MKIYLMGDMAFIQFRDSYMLCIGSKKEVDEADDEKIRQMVVEAVAHSKFRELATSAKQTLH